MLPVLGGSCGIASCWLNGVPSEVWRIVGAEQITIFFHLCPRIKNYKYVGCQGKYCQEILKSTTVKECQLAMNIYTVVVCFLK